MLLRHTCTLPHTRTVSRSLSLVRALHKCKSKYNEHTEPIFIRLNQLKLDDIYIIQCLKFYHKFLNKNLPAYFLNMFTQNASRHDYNTRHHLRLNTPTYRTAAYKHCIRHHIPYLLTHLDTCMTDKLTPHSLEGLTRY